MHAASARRSFADAAASYDSAAALAREVGTRMAARLDLVKLTPRRFADIGCATGDGIRELQRRYGRGSRGGLPLAVDYARPMLDAVRRRAGPWGRLLGRAPLLANADVRQLPLADGCLDLAWSNLMLHWLDDPLPAFRELHRALGVGGLLTFSMLGPDTLRELRAASSMSGAGMTTRSFLDMHDIGDMLVAAGFADPVMDMEIITMTYPGPRAFLADQRRLGVRNGLLGGGNWRAWRRTLDAWPRDDTGRIRASFEIVQGHAWKPEARETPDGRAIVRFRPR